MTTHELKCWPDFYAPLASGEKPFDLRVNDRKYQVGDVLTLREYDDRKGSYTGRQLRKRVTYVLDGVGPGCITPLKGLARGYVILGLANVDEKAP